MDEHVLQWHPGFQAVLQIELWEDRDFLTFYSEFNLTKKPLQIDTLIIKQEKGHQIRKSIGKIFRQFNIVEYKSPRDYLSINDFYKVIGYACLYQSDTERIMERSPEEITVTFVSNYFPRKLIRHLKKVHKASVKKEYPGIYYIQGMIFPIQLLINRRLSLEETMWLGRLRENLNAKEDVEILAKEYSGKEKNPLYSAAMDLIIRANKEQYEEAKGMCEALRELFAEEWAQAEENMEKRQLEMDQKQMQMDQQQVEMDRQQVEMNRQQVEMNRQQVEINQQQMQIDRKQSELTQKQSELTQRQSELTQRQTNMVKQQTKLILLQLTTLGEVSEKLKTAVIQQKDISILNDWIELAIHADSIQKFESQISGMPISA